MRALLLVLALAACGPAGALDSPGAASFQREVVMVPAGGFQAPGDSLRIGFLYPAATRATGYKVTVTASQPGWTGLPTALATTALRVDFIAVHLTAWDSVTFTGCVSGTMAGKPDAAPTCAALAVKRGPTSPPSAGWDSTLMVTQVITKPDSIVAVTLSSTQNCPYFRMLDGKVRIASGYETLPECQGYYDAMPAGDRLPGYPVALGRETRWYDFTPTWKVAVRTPRDELAHLLFAGPFG